RPGRLLKREGLSMILGTGNPNLPVAFTRVENRGGVPGDVDIPLRISRDRTSTVKADLLLDDIPLGFECISSIVEAGIEHWRALAIGPGLGWVRAHPGNVDTGILSQGQVRAADRADRQRAPLLAVDTHWRREGCTAVGGADVVDVAALIRSSQ